MCYYCKELITLLEECPQYQLIPPTSPQEELIGGGCCLSMTEIYKQYAPPNWPFIEISWSNDSGSASGGYAYNYLTIYRNDLILKGYDGNKFTINLINGRNPDIYEMRLMYNGENKEKLASAAVVNGFRNIQNLVRKLKPNTGKTTKHHHHKRVKLIHWQLEEEQEWPTIEVNQKQNQHQK